jgi:uncharacterized Zn-binding protein involved in type VI secretion
MPNPFTGRFTGGLIASVLIAGQPVVAVGSVAPNQPAHTPVGGPFQVPPTNTGTVHMGSAGTMIGGRAVARHGDPVRTCNDPVEAPVGQIIATNPSVKFG